MSFLDPSSLLVLVEPKGADAQAAFQLPENATCRRFGRARDALDYEKNDDDSSEVDLGAQFLNPNASVKVHLALSFNPGPKDLSKGFVFGSDPETCDLLLTKDKSSGVSGSHFSINVDWGTGNPIITCFSPSEGSGLRIQSDSLWELYFQTAWRVVKPGTTVSIMISENLKLAIYSPSREIREPAYSTNVQTYFKRCQGAVPEMSNLRLYDPEPTSLLVSRGRGLHTGMGYFTINTIIGKKIVLCEAKSHHNRNEDSKPLVIKRYRNVSDKWQRQVNQNLRRFCGLRHKHIITLEDIVTDWTEYMPVYLPEPPETLANRQSKQPFPEEEARELLAQVLEGLDFLHVNEIVHGGLCPSSIRIKQSRPLSIKLSDVGLHHYVELENFPERKAYASQGNPGPRNPKPVEDTWSAGVIGLNLLHLGGLPIPSPTHLTVKHAAWIKMLAERAEMLYAKEMPSPVGVKEAALFIKRVLQVEFARRLTAAQCLQDPWVMLRQRPLWPDREDSEAGSVNEDAAYEEESGEGTETKDPRAGKSKGKQPQTSRHNSVASPDNQHQQWSTAFPNSNQHQKWSTTPPNSQYSWSTPIEARNTSIVPSGNQHQQWSTTLPASQYPGSTPGAILNTSVLSSAHQHQHQQWSTALPNPQYSGSTLREIRETSVVFFPHQHQHQHQQQSTTPQTPQYAGTTSRESRHTTMKPSESISRQGSVVP